MKIYCCHRVIPRFTFHCRDTRACANTDGAAVQNTLQKLSNCVDKYQFRQPKCTLSVVPILFSSVMINNNLVCIHAAQHTLQTFDKPSGHRTVCSACPIRAIRPPDGKC